MYVHHNVEVMVKYFVHKINVHLKRSFPKITKDLECKRMRIGIGHEGCIVEGLSQCSLRQGDDDIFFILWLQKGIFFFFGVNAYYDVLFCVIV